MKVKIVEDEEQDKILIGAQVDKDLHDQLEQQAQEEDRPLASILRQSLKLYLKINKQ